MRNIAVKKRGLKRKVVIYERTVWRPVDESDYAYVPRCSICGTFKKEDLNRHWFFTGIYCIGCIQDILWDDTRTMEEMK